MAWETNPDQQLGVPHVRFRLCKRFVVDIVDHERHSGIDHVLWEDGLDGESKAVFEDMTDIGCSQQGEDETQIDQSQRNSLRASVVKTKA